MRRPTSTRSIRSLRLAAAAAVIAVPAVVVPALAPAAPAGSLTLSGGAGALTVGGTLYAKAGGAIGADVATDPDVQCVRLFDNGAPVGSQANPAGSASWHFDLTVPNVTGIQQVRATQYLSSDCRQVRGSGLASYVADSSGPRISALVTPAQNQYGWNDTAVTVRPRVNDGGLVGVDAQTVGPLLTRYGFETTGVPVALAAADLLGNRSETAVTIRIDKTAPSVSIGGVTAGANYILGGVPAGVCLASDSLSGIDTCSGHAPGGVGMRTYVATATDRAGNSASTQATYHVSYDFRWAGTNPTSVKAGGTITFRIQLLQADGTVVQAGASPTLIGGTGSATWNSTTHRYVLSEQVAGAAGTHATVGVTLDDGTQHTFVVSVT